MFKIFSWLCILLTTSVTSVELYEGQTFVCYSFSKHDREGHSSSYRRFPTQKPREFGSYYGPYKEYPPSSFYPEERSGNPWINPSKIHVKIETEEVVVENRKKECEEKKGSYVEPKCFKFEFPQMTFNDARIFCSSKGGDLWIPDLQDPFLFQKLARHFPAVFGGSNHSVWIGITYMDERFITIEGDDVTDTYIGLMSDREGGTSSCVYVELIGSILLKNAPCEDTTDFVCEFPLISEDEKSIKKIIRHFDHNYFNN